MLPSEVDGRGQKGRRVTRQRGETASRSRFERQVPGGASDIMTSRQSITAEALEEHFDKNMFQMLDFFHIAGASVSLVCEQTYRNIESFAVTSDQFDGVERLPSLAPEAETRASTSRESRTRFFKFSKSFGFNDLENGELVDVDRTIFDSGTCARVLCGLSLSELEKEGKINMQNYVSKYLNDYLEESMTLEDVFMKKSRVQESQNKENLEGDLPEAGVEASSWDEHASWCAEQVIEKATGMDYRSYIKKELMPKLGIHLPKISEDGERECYTYLYKNKKMLQLKTLQSKLTAQSGLISTTAQMNRILTEILERVRENESRGDGTGYDLLPGFGFGFKSVRFFSGSLNFFICVSAVQDNGNAIVCVEPRGKWAIWIACNTCCEEKSKFQDLFKGEPLCYFILKEFITKFGVSEEASTKSLQKWTIDPGVGCGDHVATLFCFPYVGGNSRQIFKNWYTFLPEFVQVKMISLPGRGPRINEKPHTKLLLLAEEIAIAILPILENKKFCFYGDGIGALLAFEVGRYLQVNHGLSPMWCFFSGSPSPTTYSAKYSENPLLDTSERANLGEDHKLNAAMVERLCSQKKLPMVLKENPLLARAMLPSIQSDMMMESGYKYKRQPYKHVKGDEYFCESELTTLAALTPKSSPRREGGAVLKLACPITVFREPKLSGAEEEELEEWELVTESGSVLFVQVPGSLSIDKDVKTCEDICGIIASTIGTSLTRFESWISWAARLM